MSSSLPKRGVKLHMTASDEWIEVVCECKCHVMPMKHFIACCKAPETEAGIAALISYEGNLNK